MTIKNTSCESRLFEDIIVFGGRLAYNNGIGGGGDAQDADWDTIL
jgi:hypothetical protein